MHVDQGRGRSLTTWRSGLGAPRPQIFGKSSIVADSLKAKIPKTKASCMPENRVLGCRHVTDEEEIQEKPSSRRWYHNHRTLSGYCWVTGGTMPFNRRYTTNCP
jgi:hypothetical protein